MAWTAPKTDFAPGDILNAAQMNAIGDNLIASAYGNLIDKQERTTSYTVNQTALASATDIFASDVTWTADGTTTYLLELFVPRNDTGSGGFTTFFMVDGAGAALAAVGFVGGGSGISYDAPLMRYWYTPSAGAVTVNARATFGGAAGVFYGGAGGASQPPVYLAAFGPTA
jgi:hypothetical protein